MLISIQDYEKTSTYRFIKDVIEITEPLKKLGIVHFYYVELTEIEGSHYIGGLVNNDQMMRTFIKHDGLKYEPALSPNRIIKPGLYPVSSMITSKTIKNYYNKNFMFSGMCD